MAAIILQAGKLKCETIDPRFGFAGNKNGKKLNWSTPALQKWAAALAHYARTVPGDVGYYYNERANIGFLTAGASKANFAVLEEYPYLKIHPKPKNQHNDPKRPRTRKRSGRVDLYISNKTIDAVIEAKKHWGKAGRATPDARIEAAVKDAKKDSGAALRIGCVFYVPHFRIKDCGNEVTEQQIQKEIKRYIQLGNADIWAWCFSKVNRNTKGGGQYEVNFCPGVIMALKVV